MGPRTRRTADVIAIAILAGAAYVAAAVAAIVFSYLVSGRQPVECIGGISPPLTGLRDASPTPLTMRDVIQIAGVGGTLLVALWWVLRGSRNRARLNRTVIAIALAPVVVIVAGWVGVMVSPWCL